MHVCCTTRHVTDVYTPRVCCLAHGIPGVLVWRLRPTHLADATGAEAGMHCQMQRRSEGDLVRDSQFTDCMTNEERCLYSNIRTVIKIASSLWGAVRVSTELMLGFCGPTMIMRSGGPGGKQGSAVMMERIECVPAFYHTNLPGRIPTFESVISVVSFIRICLTVSYL